MKTTPAAPTSLITRSLRGAVAVAAAAAVAAPVLTAPAAVAAPAAGTGAPTVRPEVVAHRGASGYRPEHTLAAYELAVAQGADVIEPDLVSTKDGVLVDRHENLIDGTTDVAERPEFADRKTTKVVDGVEQTGWFTEDFTLAELKTLRAKERLPETRPGSAEYDGMYQVPTLTEVLELRERLSAEYGREIGIIPEIKHPTYFDSIGLSQEEGVVEALTEFGLNKRNAPATVQSFELSNLEDLNTELGLKADTAFLLWHSGYPYDAEAAGDEERDYAYFASAEGLREARRAGVDAIGPELTMVIAPNADGSLGEDTGLVDRAHREHLEVFPYTFRAENRFLYTDFRSSSDPDAHGDVIGQVKAFLEVGIDGFFIDHPDLGVQAVDEWMEGKKEHPGKGKGRGIGRGLR
ncbi:glycerophosphodiester phosphodiesterase family protein [Micrococcus luteus]